MTTSRGESSPRDVGLVAFGRFGLGSKIRDQGPGPPIPRGRGARGFFSCPRGIIGLSGPGLQAKLISPVAHVLARNRTWSSTFAGSCANPSHPEDVIEQGPPPGSRTRPGGFENRHASATLAERRPRQESNLVLDLRRVACRPAHSKGSRDARIRTLSASVGSLLLSQEHIPIRPLRLWKIPTIGPTKRPAQALRRGIAPSLRSAPPGRHRTASTPAHRTLSEPHRRLFRGAVGLPAVARDTRGDAVRPARSPPLRTGTMWSTVIPSHPGWAPQYWQVWWSRLATLRRLKVTACPGIRS